MPEPKSWHKVACVVIILGLYVFLLWLDNAPTEDLMFLLVVVVCGLVAGLWLRRVKEG